MRIQIAVAGAILFFTLALAVPPHAPAPAPASVPAPSATPAATATAVAKRSIDIAIPMRDGTILRADLWEPAEGKAPYPVLLYRTPYGKTDESEYHAALFSAAVARGYALVVNDVRGRYRSEGEFSPYFNEGKDGYDTIEWIAKQPWSDGRIGMFGLSYPGSSQLLAAVERPPHLKAIVPAQSYVSSSSFMYYNGAFDATWPEWLYTLASPDAFKRRNLPGPKTYDEAAAKWKELGPDAFFKPLPLKSMKLLAESAPFYYEWLAHPPEDPYWEPLRLDGRLDRIDAAVFNFGGWHDSACGVKSAIQVFSALNKRAAGKTATQLLMGPWSHGAKKPYQSKAGDVDFGPDAAVDYDAEVLDWLDRHVRGLKDAGLAREPVRIFVMGENRWITSHDWPIPGTERRAYYFSSGQKLASGKPRDGSVTIKSDPRDPVVDTWGSESGSFDISKLSERRDVFVFETQALDKDLTVVGEIKAALRVSTHLPDFDLLLKVVDVGPDGKAYNLMAPTQEIQRASRSGAARKPRSPRTGTPTTIRFGEIYTANTFKRGHRIRVYLTPSWYPHFRNPQSGQPETTGGEIRSGSLTVHFGGKEASVISLPIPPQR